MSSRGTETRPTQVSASPTATAPLTPGGLRGHWLNTSGSVWCSRAWNFLPEHRSHPGKGLIPGAHDQSCCDNVFCPKPPWWLQNWQGHRWARSDCF